MRILYVEDHAAVAQLSLALLQARFGHEVELVTEGPHVLPAAQRFQPDLILIDIGLPGMNGYEVARQLREHEEFHDTLLVALTGYTQYEDKAQAYEAGFDAHFAKPMDFSHLNAVTRRENP